MELERAFQTLLDTAPDDFKYLYAFYHRKDLVDVTHTSKWRACFEDSTAPFPPINKPELIWQHLSVWLDMVLYETCAFIPLITDKHVNNVIGHPLSMWLYRYTEVIDAACCVGMIILSHLGVEEKQLPLSLLRLPNLTMRFNLILLPKIKALHEESIKELREHKPGYLELLVKK